MSGTYCTGFTFNAQNSGECFFYDKTAVEDGGTGESGATCYKRGSLDDLTGVQTKWKTAMDKIDDYNTKWTSYNNKINTDWATYKTKNEVEVKRLATVDEWTKE